jgi:hypothetical protein
MTLLFICLGILHTAADLGHANFINQGSVGLFRLRLSLRRSSSRTKTTGSPATADTIFFFYCSSISKGIIFRRWWLLYESRNSTLDFYFIVFRYFLGFHLDPIRLL